MGVMSRKHSLSDVCIANIRREMTSRGWSQRELSRRSGVHWQTIWGLFNSKQQSPTIDTVERLAKALDIVPDKIFQKKR